jgi:hypothetical protein
MKVMLVLSLYPPIVPGHKIPEAVDLHLLSAAQIGDIFLTASLPVRLHNVAIG